MGNSKTEDALLMISARLSLLELLVEQLIWQLSEASPQGDLAVARLMEEIDAAIRRAAEGGGLEAREAQFIFGRMGDFRESLLKRHEAKQRRRPAN